MNVRTISILGLMTLLAIQTGCTFSLQDAVTAGVFDFVSGSITELLTSAVLPG